MTFLPPDPVIFGVTGQMQKIRTEIEKLANTDLPVLIEGESGTGKGVLAQWIHHHSLRQSGPLIKVHCPALPAMLFESDLLGYERSTLAAALRQKAGRLEEAGEGTLFLDGISELGAESQAKLLRLLQDGRFTHIGGREGCRVTARFICSAHGSLAERVDVDEFRKDLFYRINAIHLLLPPLRMRLADIPAISDFMLETWSRSYGAPVRPFSTELMNLFQASMWPGNICQLENMIRRYVVLGGDEESVIAELLDGVETDPLSAVASGRPVALKKVVRERVREQERRIILRALHSCHWNRKKTAKALGISYQGLLNKMRQDQLYPQRLNEAGRHNLPAASHHGDRVSCVN